ncbi:MAG: S1/P1 nuclease [Gemmatimonadetes bacterium]|nr:S1/P1 nuclease [Gemmatimonadota bacterium]
MKFLFTLCSALILLVLGVSPTLAWDDFGHRLVARIAWENMTPQARARAISILRGAAPETRLAGAGGTGTLSPQQQMELFANAAVWPDSIRNVNDPRNEKYDHPYRHYVDISWRQATDFGPVQPSDHREQGDLLRDVSRLQQKLTGGTPEEQATALAWILHLVGDIHQPLHASARVTPRDECGDAGGNDFKLEVLQGDRRRTLHSVWDGIITDNLRKSSEPLETSLTRALTEVTQRHPRGEFASEIGQTDFRQWARESVAIAQRSVYRAPLARDHAAPAAYRQAAFRAAEPRVALAGYRLADLLNQALGS